MLAEVNLNQPETSRFLIKAVSDHAHTGQAPLRDPQAAAYRTLENWVKRTVADNPYLREKPEIRNPKSETPALQTEEARPKSGEESEWGSDGRMLGAAPVPSPLAATDKGNVVRPASPSAPVTLMIRSHSIRKCIPKRTSPNREDERRSSRYQEMNV